MSLYTVAYNYCTSSKMHGAPSEAIGMGGRCEQAFAAQSLVDLDRPHSWCKSDGFRFVQQPYSILCDASEGFTRGKSSVYGETKVILTNYLRKPKHCRMKLFYDTIRPSG